MQKELTNKTENNLRRETTQVIEYQRKMQENATLIEEMTRIKKFNTSLEEEIKTLKYKIIMQNININKLKESLKEYKNINNNGSKVNNNDTSTVQNSGIDSKILGFNSSQSTSPSEILPIINSNTKLNAGSLKNFRNRIIKAGASFNISNDKMLKFKEIKRIIEGKNDIIQRLTMENEFLRNYNYNNPLNTNNTSEINRSQSPQCSTINNSRFDENKKN